MLKKGTAGPCNQLGKLNLLGEHVPVDPEKGMFWLKKAAMNGNSQAMFQLGKIYLSGELVGRDLNEAKKMVCDDC